MLLPLLSPLRSADTYLPWFWGINIGLAQIGPLGLSPKKVGDDIAKSTQDWKGLRIMVKLIVQNRQAKVL